MNYQWLLFDLDNTLMDFDRAALHALDQSLTDFDLPVTTEHKAIYHRINAACWKAFEDGTLKKEELRVKRFELFFEAIAIKRDPVHFGKTYLDYLSQGAFLYEGAEELLESFSANKKLALITNGLKEVQRPRLQQSGITKYFEVLVVSDEIGHSKPHSAFFDYAFRQMGQPEKSTALVIGDSLNSDMRGGIQYGVDTCWYNPTKKENTSGLEPKFEIQNLKELLPVVG